MSAYTDLKFAEMREWLVSYISTALDIPEEEISTEDTFDVFGLDSIEAVIMVGNIEEEFMITASASALYDHPTIDAFAAFLAGGGNTASAG